MVFCKLLFFLFVLNLIFFVNGNEDQVDYLSNLIDQMNEELLELNKISATLEWKSATNFSSDIMLSKSKYYMLRSAWKLKWCNFFIDYKGIQEIIEEKIVYYLCRGAKYTPEEAQQLTKISEKLLEAYQSRKVCRIEENNEEKCYNGERDLKRFMKQSKNEKELRWAWTSWRNKMSSVNNLYLQSLFLQNKGARRNGYRDTGEIWREEMNMINVENSADKLWNSVKSLYQLLHAVVRFKLKEKYPNLIDKFGAIPAHLLGDLWSQNWVALVDMILPNSTGTLDITKKLLMKNYSVMDMAKRSEDFYESIGFPRMTKKFWDNSIMIRINGSNGNCHGTAANMFDNDDFRILGCFEVDLEDFLVVHHEMGHVQYYMAYEEQPAIFRVKGLLFKLLKLIVK